MICGLAMANPPLLPIYRSYINAINTHTSLEPFVHANVIHNDKTMSIAEYTALIESAFEGAPDIRFVVTMEIADADTVAARIMFDCVPKPPEFIGLAVSEPGKRVRFAENVFYRFREGKIKRVWSVVDVKSVEDQLKGP